MMKADDLAKEARQRLKDARDKKSEIERDLREAYFFTDPQRNRDLTTTGTAAKKLPKDDSLLQISLGIECAQDFATELASTFTPETVDWIKLKPGVEVPPDDYSEVEDALEEANDLILRAMKESNFYAAQSQVYMPDAALGTMAIIIYPGEVAGTPVDCRAVPLSELEINIGPDGDIDDRFIVRNTKHRYLSALLPSVDLPSELKKGMKDNPDKAIQVIWGWWRDWEVKGDIAWKHVILAGGKVVYFENLKGEGSCPLLIFRFNTKPDFPYGFGPALQSLPELRAHDEIEALTVENADFQIHPPFMYQDDGVTNFDNGIIPGYGYPARPWGNGKPVEPLVFSGNVQFAEFEKLSREHRIRRMFFVDQPEQDGKTPPTATQWADERARAKRRIGTPGKVFFKEGPMEIFLRFKFILSAQGIIPPITVKGREVSVIPYDPTEQAQDYQDAQTAIQFVGVVQQTFPELSQVLLKPLETINNIKKAMGEKLVEVNTKEEMESAMQQMQMMQQQMQQPQEVATNPEEGMM